MSDCRKRCIVDQCYCSDRKPPLPHQRNKPLLTHLDTCELDMCRNPRTFYLESNNTALTRYCLIRMFPTASYITMRNLANATQTNAGNQVAISVPVIKLMATAEHVWHPPFQPSISLLTRHR
jgi:hypothetical protein